MTNACVTNQYYSGQGALLLAERVADVPQGYRPVGNVSALSLTIETTVFEHKESCSGTRGIDLEIVQEINVTMAMTMESLDKENLAIVLYGSSSEIVGAAAADETVTSRHDLWVPMANINVSAVVVGDDAIPTTTYVLDVDYELNEVAGAIKVLSTGSIPDATVIFLDYTYGVQDDIQAVESGSPPVRAAMFQGLNTAESDKPVVVYVHKASFQPLAELALINEELTQMEVEAKVLADASITVGSQYFYVRQVV